jgi:hypothetical protein
MTVLGARSKSPIGQRRTLSGQPGAAALGYRLPCAVRCLAGLRSNIVRGCASPGRSDSRRQRAGVSALLTGDARADDVLAGAIACGLLEDAEPLCVTVLKQPHHGSDRNVTAFFFERIQADSIIIVPQV